MWWCFLSTRYNLCSKFAIEYKHGNAPKNLCNQVTHWIIKELRRVKKTTAWLKVQNYRSKEKLLCGIELS